MSTKTECAFSCVDEDGDLVSDESVRITCTHETKSSLDEVGVQLWRPALLLCDWLMANRSRFYDASSVHDDAGTNALKHNGPVFLELGAGIGLPSILAAKLGLSKRIFCTDYLASVLELAQWNIAGNKVEETVSIRQLDWTDDAKNSWLFCSQMTECGRDNVLSRTNIDKDLHSNPFSMTLEDRRALSEADQFVFLASDVAYDDSLTSAFARCLRGFLSELSRARKSAEVIIALEKRTNFELASLSARPHAYDCLVSELHDVGLQFELQDLSKLPKCSVYERSSDLVLMNIKL